MDVFGIRCRIGRAAGARRIRRAAGALMMCIVVACAAIAATLMTPREARSASAEPYFLVATRDLTDSIFAQSVILILPAGRLPIVVGVIINKPTAVPVQRLFSNAPAFKSPAATAYLGGPVDPDQPALLIRASQSSDKTTHLFDDVYASADTNSIGELLKNSAPDKDLRVILGRAQWTPDQLQAEIQEGSWYVAPAKSEVIFSADPASVWRVLVNRGQMQEVDWTRAREPNVFGFIRCTDESGAWLPVPARDR